MTVTIHLHFPFVDQGFPHLLLMYPPVECNIYSPRLNKERGVPEDQPQFLMNWLLADVQAIKSPTCFCFPAKLEELTVADAILRYSILHKEIFGSYAYGLPPRPDAKNMKKIDMTFMHYVTVHRLEALIPIFLLGTSAQGYGLLETMPAFYGLWWNSPELLDSLVNNQPLTQMWRKGFQNLWQTMADKDELNIIFDATVTSVTRSLTDTSKPVTIKATVGRAEETYDCDLLIVTVPFKVFFSTVVTDTTPEEKEYFSALIPATLLSSLVKTNVQHEEERATTYYPERLSPSQQGRFYAERNSNRAIWPDREQAKDYRFSVAYQYFEDFKEGREAVAKEELTKGMKEAGYQEVTILNCYNWAYFYKYSRENIKKGYPWKVLEMQGHNRTIYAGSSACFESVEDVVSYNHLILQTFGIE